MCFKKKSLDYEILKAVAERKEALIDGGVVSIERLAQGLGVDSKSVIERANFLCRDKLVGLSSTGIDSDNGYISSITPEGRILLDRLESNRWQSRWSERAIGAVITVMTGLLIAAVVYFLNLNGNASGVVR